MNLDELNKCSLADRSGKRKKKRFPLSFLISYESLVSVKENTDRKKKKKERKKNTDRTQTNLNAPHIQYMQKYYPNN